MKTNSKIHSNSYKVFIFLYLNYIHRQTKTTMTNQEGDYRRQENLSYFSTCSSTFFLLFEQGGLGFSFCAESCKLCSWPWEHVTPGRRMGPVRSRCPSPQQRSKGPGRTELPAPTSVDTVRVLIYPDTQMASWEEEEEKGTELRRQ